MIDKFTASSRYSLFLAGYESAAWSPSDIEPSHILLAIMYLYPAVLARVVGSRGNLVQLRQRLVEALSQRVGHVVGDKEFQFDDEARCVLLSAAREAKSMWKTSMSFRSRFEAFAFGRRRYVDPCHILLAILGEQAGISTELLKEYGASLDAIRGMIGHTQPPTVEPSIVSNLVGVTGEFVDLRLKSESRAQLNRFLGEGALRYTSALYLTILGACYEATRLGADLVGAEHLLPGFFAGSAIHLRGTRAIESALGSIQQVRATIGPDTAVSMTPEQLSVQARTVLTYAEEESMHLGHREIGTGHLLLGLLRWRDSPAAEHLERRGIELGTMRSRLSAPDFL